MKRIWIVLIMLLMLPAIYSEDNTLPWYNVEQWEIEVCSKWGGTATAQETAGEATGNSYMFSTTVTLQAQKTASVTASGNATIYEVAWYFRPLTKQQQYSIQLIGTDTKTVYTGSSSPETGESNYHAEESTKVYTKAKITYEDGTLTVPFVEK